MVSRHAPSGEESLKQQDSVHSYGQETGDHERMIVFLLGSTGKIAAAIASRAIHTELEAMNGHAPHGIIESVPGAIRFDLGHTSHEVALELATSGLEAITRTQGELTPEEWGVGVSVKIMVFPDSNDSV